MYFSIFFQIKLVFLYPFSRILNCWFHTFCYFCSSLLTNFCSLFAPNGCHLKPNQGVETGALPPPSLHCQTYLSLLIMSHSLVRIAEAGLLPICHMRFSGRQIYFGGGIFSAIKDNVRIPILECKMVVQYLSLELFQFFCYLLNNKVCIL